MSVQSADPFHPRPEGQGFRNTGWVFAVLGVLAILAPMIATVVVEQLIGWILVFWGIAGILFARNFRAFSEWRIVAAGFVAVLLLGLWFLFVPGVGASFMTVLLIVAFLVEGGLSILLGLRMSGQLPDWPWIVVSGACAFVLGLIVLFQWPQTTSWVIGFMVGLNFLSTGISMLAIARALRIAR